MESSEDDAGTATNASRRESAREKDIAQIEDNNATASVHQGPSEARESYQTPAMSEENYDSESVPSPSTQDLNTSTEAILDMIDEFVDGPKRLSSGSSQVPAAAPTTSATPASTEDDHKQESDKTPSPVTSAKSENISQENIGDIHMECASNYDVSIETNTEKHENLNSCSVSLEAKEMPVAPLEESALTASDVSSVCLVTNHPSSSVSVEESVTNNLDVSQSQERTVKCVTSSDNQDKVTIENAESTSAVDGSSSVSVVPTVSAPGQTRSPLRRRLIRPAPSDRKPDTTVSSTVDSQVCGLHTEQTVSESIAKDVSSSSDAVLSTHDNVIKDYENRSVSEISVCKAETSVSSPKKIKINRQRLTPSTSQLPELLLQRQCQPSSSNSAASASIESDCHSSSHISTSEPSVTLTSISSESSIHNDSPVQVSESNNDYSDQLQECQESNLSSNVMTKDDNKDISLNVPSGSEIFSDERSISNTEPISEIDTAKESVVEDTDSTKQVPKLTIKLGVKPSEELKSPIPKLTIKPIKPPTGETSGSKVEDPEKIPNVTKINIKPILKPPEKINDTHRKSSSSEISESEYSENDESTSDQASTSDQGSTNIVPKVTIKLGKPGTESECKLYTEQKVPKLTIKGLHCIENENVESASTLKLIKNEEKVPKLTIKTVMKSETQPTSPKLTIKPIKPPENEIKQSDNNQHTPKIKISPETLSLSGDIKENTHVPKITIKPVTKSDSELTVKTPKKISNDSEIIPVVTKLNIKPVLKPMCASESNVEPVSEVNKFNSNVDEIPKITKLNIKPLRNPEGNISKEKDCDEMSDNKEKNLPVVTKLNIKPIVKPPEEDNKDSDNQSSETGSSSDDNVESIPAVTKLNIKPIVKPSELEELTQSKSSNEENIPVVTKLNIKPVLKPVDAISPKSPKKDPNLKAMDPKLSEIPVVTKLNIKPIVKPAESQFEQEKTKEIGDMKNPPLVMKINMKAVTDTSLLVEEMPSNSLDSKDHVYNNVDENLPVVSKVIIKPVVDLQNDTHEDTDKALHNDIVNCKYNSNEEQVGKDVPCQLSEKDIEIQDVSRIDGESQFCKDHTNATQDLEVSSDSSSVHSLPVNEEPTIDVNMKSSLSPISRKDAKHTSEPASKLNQMHEEIATNKITDLKMSDLHKQEISAIQNCTLLKQLLVSNKDISDKKQDRNVHTNLSHKDKGIDSEIPNRFGTGEINDLNFSPLTTKTHPLQELIKGANENVTKPLEINTCDKHINQDSGQDSPRIILKINKTEQGPLAKIITDDVKSDTDLQHTSSTNVSEVNDKVNLKKSVINSRRKASSDTSSNIPMGKRLRSSRVVQDVEKSAAIRRNSNKRPSTTEISPTQVKEQDITILETKRLKLGQLLSNKSLKITPILTTSTKSTNTSPTRKAVSEIKQGLKVANHSLLNNENCSKNGNSKLHSIISNLQANRLQEMSFNLINHSELKQPIVTEVDSNTSTGSSDVTGSTSLENCHPEVQEMIIQENSESREFNVPDEISQDPLEVTPKSLSEASNSPNIPIGTNLLELTPQPKKRGRPRKLPVSEGAKPIITLPTTALEERPQRSLRLSRDRPAILAKPRGRGRGRGSKRGTVTHSAEVIVVTDTEEAECKPGEIDPTSSRVKLPRMTEALDKMPSACTATPLSSRRRSSHSSNELKLFPDTPELKVVLENTPTIGLAFVKSPDDESGDSRGPRGGRGRGSRGGRGRGTPRGSRSRGRGRGGGRGAIYMKETMGIYGRVCGPSTTTVQLFEEETCMMDDNATPSKPSHLIDEDSQSSVKSSTNESSKTKKSKFADLFDSSKWTAAEVKEYSWPPSDKPSSEQQVMMIQEQVAMFLGVKSFKRRYPELKRRTVVGEEKDYILSKGVVTEALCDLGITAVDASDVLDIMLSDYPHKYEEYRSHQRQKTRNETSTTGETATVNKTEEGSLEKVEMKLETKVELKPEPPKVDPEKTKQDLALAAIASASEWNTRMNVARRRACADLQSLSVLCCAPPQATPPAPPRTHVRPPAGFYPHALLPGQYQHAYRRYPADQLRYFPLNTVMATPVMADSSSESEADWGSCSDSHDSDLDRPTHSAKRKKLTKQKRSSVAEAGGSGSGSGAVREETSGAGRVEEPPELCRECKLREEGNRKYSYERFLSCAKCDAKLHPACVDLSADTVRKCRDYAWQCADCKTCQACNDARAVDMLFCDLCDRGFHAQCVGLPKVPQGRWHCVECAICKSCGARDPGGLGTGDAGGTPGGAAPEWHHQTRRGPGGHKLYSHSLCTPCARMR